LLISKKLYAIDADNAEVPNPIISEQAIKNDKSKWLDVFFLKNKTSVSGIPVKIRTEITEIEIAIISIIGAFR
jgi:hypothetical protein